MKMNLYDVFFFLAIQNLENMKIPNEERMIIAISAIEILPSTSFSRKLELVYEELLLEAINTYEKLPDGALFWFGKYKSEFLLTSPHYDEKFYNTNKSFFCDKNDMITISLLGDLQELISQQEYALSLTDSEA